MEFVYKSQAEITAMTDSEREDYATKKRAHEEALIEKKAKEEAEKLVAKAKEESTEAIKKAKEENEEAIKKANEANALALKATNDELAKVSAAVKKAGQITAGEGESVEKSIVSNQEAIKKSAVKGSPEAEFVVKADTLRANVVGNPAALDLRDIGQIAHRKLTLYDLFPKVPVSKDLNGVVRYTDWDEATSVRGAKAIAEGAAYAQSTAKWLTKSIELKKIGDIIPMSEELAYDASRFAAELSLFLQTNVDMIVDTQLYSGTGLTVNIAGIGSYVPAFVPVASGIQDASIYDLIVKVSESITKTGGSKFAPNFVLMNISTINMMRLKKDENNNYIIPPFVGRDGKDVAGIIVVESNGVADNELILGDNRYARIYEEPGFTITTGHATGDFEEDMISVKARRRLNLLIRECDKPGFRKVTSISAALTTLATAVGG